MAKTILITPKGKAKYAYIGRTNAKGKYTVAITVDPSTKEYTDFIAKYAETEKDFGKAFRGKPLAKKDVDKEGNETGLFLINFTASNYPFKLFDAAGTSIKDDHFNVGWDSVIRVSFVLDEFDRDGNKGLAKLVKGIQIIELVESGVTAAACGFSAEESGYEYKQTAHITAAEGQTEEINWEE